MEVILYSMCSKYKKRWCFLSLEEFTNWIKYHSNRCFTVSWDDSCLHIGFQPLMDKDENEESVKDIEMAIDKSLRKFFKCFECERIKPKQEFNVQKLSCNIQICNQCDNIT